MIQQILRDRYAEFLTGLDIYENRTSLILSRIILNKESRGKNKGTEIMTDLIDYADRNKQIVALTPSADFGGNKNKLIQFYKRFGFKHNKGQYKHFEFKEDMIRYPRGMNESIKPKIKSLLREGLLTEIASGKHLIVIDVQPEYAQGFGNLHKHLFSYINKNYNNFADVTFLYNGEDTLGMISEHDYRDWLMENGLHETIAYDVRLYDKGYAFFRYCIDNAIDDENVVNLVREMYENNINDSRELDEEFWNNYVQKYGDEDIRELLEFSDDCINMPDLMDFLKHYNNIVLVGGHINECLKEVEIALDALNKDYQTWSKYIY